MKRLLTTALIAAPLLAAPLLASAAGPANLLTDGSFESGLASWSVGNTGAFTYGPTPFSYSTSLAEVFETIAPDNAASMSPDAAGLKAVWLVDDSATNIQSLSQSFTVIGGGLYTAGFSVYATSLGYGNANNAAFTAAIDGTPIATTSSTVGALSSTTWTALSGTSALTPGLHTFSISFAATGVPSKDIAIDRAFVTSAVPEPESYALMVLGLAFVGSIARRRKQA